MRRQTGYCPPFPLLAAGAFLLGSVLPAVIQGQATDPPGKPAVTWQTISGDGVVRASAVVDSVFVDRTVARTAVAGGDFAAYLMARLGVRRFPPDFNFRVNVDSSLIRIGGRVMDLPTEARNALGAVVMFLSPETRLEAQVEMIPEGPRAIHFHLRSTTVDGVPIPGGLLDAGMAEVGRQYPALTSSGRDLFVEIPSAATVTFATDSVVLRGP